MHGSTLYKIPHMENALSNGEEHNNNIGLMVKHMLCLIIASIFA
jgi:hypothetical protein